MSAIDSDTFPLDAYAIKVIRHALVIGLASFGEIERVLDRVDLCRSVGQKIPDDIIPMHPTGCNDTTGNFAEALRWLELVEKD